MQAIAPVAGKILIATIAGERYRDMLACQLAYAPGGQRGTVGKRFIVDSRQHIQQVVILRADAFLEVPGVQMLGDLPRIGGFIEPAVVKADRAGVDRLPGRAAHAGNHCA